MRRDGCASLPERPLRSERDVVSGQPFASGDGRFDLLAVAGAHQKRRHTLERKADLVDQLIRVMQGLTLIERDFLELRSKLAHFRVRRCAQEPIATDVRCQRFASITAPSDGTETAAWAWCAPTSAYDGSNLPGPHYPRRRDKGLFHGMTCTRHTACLFAGDDGLRGLEGLGRLGNESQ